MLDTVFTETPRATALRAREAWRAPGCHAGAPGRAPAVRPLGRRRRRAEARGAPHHRGDAQVPEGSSRASATRRLLDDSFADLDWVVHHVVTERRPGRRPLDGVRTEGRARRRLRRQGCRRDRVPSTSRSRTRTGCGSPRTARSPGTGAIATISAWRCSSVDPAVARVPHRDGAGSAAARAFLREPQRRRRPGGSSQMSATFGWAISTRSFGSMRTPWR